MEKRVRGSEGSHKINAPTMKWFNFNDSCKGHLIPLRNVTCPLAFITPLNKVLAVLEQGGPPEATLQDFSNGFFSNMVAPIS